MDDFVNAFKKDPKVRIKINGMLNRYNRLPLEYQSKIGCDSLIQNVILKGLINIMATVITDLDIKLKMKISRIECLEKKLLRLCILFSIKISIIYVTEYYTKCYGVTFQNNG